MNAFTWNPRKKILITGAAGFIGSALWRRLAELLTHAGHDPDLILLACDLPAHFTERPELFASTPQICDRDDLFAQLQKNSYGEIGAIFHIGACSSTLQLDENYLWKMNEEYSRKIWQYARAHGIPLIYASSGATYGLGIEGRAETEAYDDSPEALSLLKPISPYGWSKHRFDLWAMEETLAHRMPPHWAGFKFFNVYGWGESHKGTGASMAYHWYRQINKTGIAHLFKSYRPDYQDGHQKRDFIFIGDIVTVLCATLQSYSGPRPIQNGVYNLGTGKAQSWLSLSQAIFTALNIPPKVQWIEMPVDLRERYQYFTQAKMGRLLCQLPDFQFTSLEKGVKTYIDELRQRG